MARVTMIRSRIAGRFPGLPVRGLLRVAYLLHAVYRPAGVRLAGWQFGEATHSTVLRWGGPGGPSRASRSGNHRVDGPPDGLPSPTGGRLASARRLGAAGVSGGDSVRRGAGR